MTFTSIEELKEYIQNKLSSSVTMATETVYQIIDKFVKQYYAEFSPSMYERTYQLYRSLVKTRAIATGNGFEAEVYFDLDSLDYAIKHLNGKLVPNSGWSEAASLDAAAHGSHGGYVSGTAIWDEPLKILDAQGIDILKKALVTHGIPVR